MAFLPVPRADFPQNCELTMRVSSTFADTIPPSNMQRAQAAFHDLVRMKLQDSSDHEWPRATLSPSFVAYDYTAP